MAAAKAIIEDSAKVLKKVNIGGALSSISGAFSRGAIESAKSVGSAAKETIRIGSKVAPYGVIATIGVAGGALLANTAAQGMTDLGQGASNLEHGILGGTAPVVGPTPGANRTNDGSNGTDSKDLSQSGAGTVNYYAIDPSAGGSTSNDNAAKTGGDNNWMWIAGAVGVVGAAYLLTRKKHAGK